MSDRLPSRVRSLRAIACGIMVLFGLAMMFGGSLARQHATQSSMLIPAIPGATKQQTLRTVSDVTVLLGGMLLCLGTLMGAKLLTRPVDTRRRSRRSPPPVSDRPFTDRLTKYLEEGPTPAVHTGRGSSRSFFLAMLPGPRRGPKSQSAIRAILLRIRALVCGSD